MGNQLGMAEQQAIIALARNGWFQQRIARELGVHRETIGRYVKLWQDAQPGVIRRRTLRQNQSTNACRHLGAGGLTTSIARR